METKFKTTIKCSGCVAKATPFLDEALGKGNWEVDYEDAAKVLTVKKDEKTRTVIDAVERAGFKAEKI